MRSLLLLLACTSALSACCSSYSPYLCNLGPVVPPPPSDIPTRTRAEPAPPPAGGAAAPYDVLGDALIRDMRAALADMASAQERFRSVTGSYASEIRQLRRRAGLRVPSRILLQIESAASRSWSGRAAHPVLPDHSCVISVGPPGEAPRIATSLGTHRGDTSPGTIVCDQSVYEPDTLAPAAPETVSHATPGSIRRKRAAR
jgi:hypothetical protein